MKIEEKKTIALRALQAIVNSPTIISNLNYPGIHTALDHQSAKGEEFKLIARNVKFSSPIVEFGVYKGHSINQIASAFPDHKVFGFDTFTGLPEDWDQGATLKKAGHFTTGGMLPKVKSNVTLIKGLIQDTLPGWINEHPEPLAFINIDTDLYSSAIFILTALNSQLIPETIIRFDELSDWKLLAGTPDPRAIKQYPLWEEGEWKALLEWLENYGREVTPLARNLFYSAVLEVTK